MSPEGGSQGDHKMTPEQIKRHEALREFLRSATTQGGVYGSEGQSEPETPEHEPEHELETDIETGQDMEAEPPAEPAVTELPTTEQLEEPARTAEEPARTAEEPKTAHVNQGFLDRLAELADSDDELEEDTRDAEQHNGEDGVTGGSAAEREPDRQPALEPEAESEQEPEHTAEPTVGEEHPEEAESEPIVEGMEEVTRESIDAEVKEHISKGEGRKALEEAHRLLQTSLETGTIQTLQAKLSYKIRELITKDAVQGIDGKAKTILTALFMTRLSPRQAAAAAELTLMAAERALDKSGQEGGLQGLTDRLVKKLQDWKRSDDEEEQELAERGLKALEEAEEAEERGADEAGQDAGPQEGEGSQEAGPQEGETQEGEGQQEGEGDQGGQETQGTEDDEAGRDVPRNLEQDMMGEGLMIERINVSDEVNQLAQSYVAGISDKNEDLQIREAKGVEYAKDKLAGRFPHQIQEKKITDSTGVEIVVYYIEFNLLDRTDCEFFCGDHAVVRRKSESLIGKLTLEGRSDNLTKEELKVLRTFDLERQVTLSDRGETTLLAEYFGIRADGHPPDDFPQTYIRYKENLCALVHSLNAFTREEPTNGQRSAISIEEETANSMRNRFNNLMLIAERINEGIVPIQVDMPVSTARFGERDYGAMRESGLSPSQWVDVNVGLYDAFARELQPLLESISRVVRKANALNEDVYDPNTSIESIVALGQNLDQRDVARVLRSNRHLDRAMQAYMIGLQRAGAESVGRIIGTDFGHLDPITKLEPAMQDAVAMLVAEEMSRPRSADERPFDRDRDVKQIEYAVRLAGGLHKYYGGFWSYLASIVDGEMMTGSKKDNGRIKQERIRAAPQNGLVKKVMQLSTVEAEMYGPTLLDAVYGIPASRYFTATRTPEVTEGVPSNREGYIETRGLFADARRNGSDRMVALRRNFIFLRDVIKKPAGDLLLAGGWRNPQLKRLIDRVSAEQLAADVGPEDMIFHETVINRVREEWGSRGVVEYIEASLDKMIEADEDYHADVEKFEKEKDAAKKPRGILGRLVTGVTTPDDVMERWREFQDRARAKYLALHVYRPLLERNPAMALVLEDRALTPEAHSLTIRDELKMWLTQRLTDQQYVRLQDAAGPNELVDRSTILAGSEATKRFRIYEMLLHHSYRELSGGIPTQEVVREIARLYLKKEEVDSIDFDAWRHEFMLLKAEYERVVRARDLPALFAEHHSLRLGSYDVQLTSPEAVYSRLLSHHIIEPLADLKTLQEIKDLEASLFGRGGVLDGVKIRDQQSAETEAGKFIAPITDLVKKLTPKESEQIRLKAIIATIVTRAVAEIDESETICGKNEGLEGQRKFNRFYFALHLLKGLGIPFDNYDSDMKEMNPINAKHILRSLGVPYNIYLAGHGISAQAKK